MTEFLVITEGLCIRPTDELISNLIGVTTLHVSGSLSAHNQEFLAYIIIIIIIIII
jgi:hypothetical protein